MDYKEDDCYTGKIEDIDYFEGLNQQIQDDLIEWFNVAVPDDEDKKLLLKLYIDDRFYAWDCPECNTRVFRGDPDSWDDFQSSQNQDFSYFGNPDKYQQDYIDACCDSCRCNKLR